MPTEFTPFASGIGGLLIGLSAALMFVLNGRITGISGIVGGVLGGPLGEGRWRLAFVAGLLCGGLAMYLTMPDQFGSQPTTSAGGVVLSGVCVGVGTRLGGGCTSGHGVCGISRLSLRSLVATSTFMLVAVFTVFVTRHLS